MFDTNLLSRLASKSDMGFKLSAVLYDNHGHILGRGYNYKVPSKRRFGSNLSVHAEMMCLYNAVHKRGLRYVQGSTMVIFRHGKNSKPCIRCREMLKRMGVKHIIYSHSGQYHEEAP